MKILLFLGAILFSFLVEAQNFTVTFAGKIENFDTKKAEGGVTVSAMSGGKVLGSGQSASNGKYGFETEAAKGSTIQLIISKPGFVSKRVDISLAGINDEDLPADGVIPFTIPGQIFAERPGVDFSFTKNEPVLLVNWDGTSQQFMFEPSAKTKKKIDDLLASGANKATEDEAKYQAAVKAGEGLYNQKKYEEALAKYEEASSIKPKEPVPLAKIAELDKLIKDQKNQAQASAQLETEYKNLISAADNLRDQKKYTESLAKYNEALKKKDDAYPKAEIAKLNKLIEDQKAAAAKDAEFENLKKEGMALATSKKWSEAKGKLNQALAIKADATITQKIKEIDAELAKESADKQKTEKYNAAMTLADGLVKSGKYVEAKAKYTEAGTIDPSQTLPKTKIAEVNDLIAKQGAEAEKKAKIDKLIAEGNTAFGKNDLATAKSKFEEVLTNDAGNTIATAKLKEINTKLDAAKGQAEKDAQFESLKKEGMALATAKKYNEAKIKLQQAVDMKPDAAISQKIKDIDDILKAEQAKSSAEENYKRILSEASTLESSKNYDGAIAKYKEALTLKPTEILPKTKITELEKLKKEAAGQSQAEAQKTALYNSHMTNGAKNLSEKKYKQALTDFQNALSVKPGDSNAQGKISEVQQILDDLENSANKDDEAKKNFDKLVAEADRLFKIKDYMSAKAVYEKALAIISTDQRVIKQVSECDRLEKVISATEADKEYNKIISAADKKFNEKDYLKAKEYYERALKNRLTDPYPKAKLLEIEKLLNPTPDVVKTNVPVEPEKLKDLGIPYDKSEEQGMADLRAAQIARENDHNKTLKEGIQVVIDSQDEKSEQKQQEQLETTAGIVDLQSKLAAETQDQSDKHQDVIELNKSVEKQINDFNVEANTMEHSDHLNIQEKMDLVAVENDEAFSESLNQYMNKGDEMKQHNSTLADANVEQTQKYDDVNQASIVGIREVEKQIHEKQIDDKESRLAVEERIETIVDKSVQLETDLIDKENVQNLDTKGKITAADKNMGTNFELDVQNSKETLNDLEKIKHEVQESKDISAQKDIENGDQVTQQMVELNTKLADEVMSNNEQLQMSTEVLKLASKDLNDKLVDDYNKEMVKHLASQQALNEKTKVVNDSETASTDKLIENNGLIKDMATSLQDENLDKEASQVEKHQNTQQALNEKHNEVTAEKPVVANALGAQYPEGVSQESFTQNDENGLMKAIITRRVVVIAGKGDVYVKTQTLGNITYTKNGKPTTEMTWQKETQGPHLKKNY